MRSWSKLGVVAFVGVVGLVGRVAHAGPLPGPSFDDQARTCEANVQRFDADVRFITLMSTLFIIGGAVISGTSSALAAFLTKAPQRKVAGVVGALSAVLTTASATLPDKQAAQAKLSAAEAHQAIAISYMNQLQFAAPGESTVSAQKYITARFATCGAKIPTLPVPPFEEKLADSSIPPFSAFTAPVGALPAPVPDALPISSASAASAATPLHFIPTKGNPSQGAPAPPIRLSDTSERF